MEPLQPNGSPTWCSSCFWRSTTVSQRVNITLSDDSVKSCGTAILFVCCVRRNTVCFRRIWCNSDCQIVPLWLRNHEFRPARLKKSLTKDVPTERTTDPETAASVHPDYRGNNKQAITRSVNCATSQSSPKISNKIATPSCTNHVSTTYRECISQAFSAH